MTQATSMASAATSTHQGSKVYNDAASILLLLHKKSLNLCMCKLKAMERVTRQKKTLPFFAR